MFNIRIQLFANGATGFNVNTREGMYDMALWLAMWEAVALVTPSESVLCDGAPAHEGAFSGVS
jgi:hypothetical protein